MGRPSLKQQRSAEILDAFARCVVRHGVEGSTLEQIAEEAGVNRTILRHYIGNREDLIHALSARVEREFMSATQTIFDELPDTDRVEWLVDTLFDPETYTNSDDVAVAQALIAASEQYPDIANRLRAWVVTFDELIARELVAAYPAASKSDIQAVSFGLLGIYFNVDALAPLNLPDRLDDAAKRAAWRLVRSLEV